MIKSKKKIFFLLLICYILTFLILQVFYKIYFTIFFIFSHFPMFLLPYFSNENYEFQLKNNGISKNLGNISHFQCDECLNFIRERERNIQSTEIGNINSSFRRKDIFLPVEGPIYTIIKSTILNWKKQSSFLYNKEAKIIEVGCFISYPFCFGQSIHKDTSDSIQYKNCISFGIFLHDVNSRFSPLLVQSNVKKNKWNIITGKKGEMYGWSAACYHGGSANWTNKKRYLFYFTILYPPLKTIDVGGYSLLPKYKEGILLTNLL